MIFISGLLVGCSDSTGPEPEPKSPVTLDNQIVFMSDRDGDDEIFVMNADGTELTQLTDNSIIDAYPVFSPDGAHIAVDDGEGISVINTDGSGPVTNITNNPSDDTDPYWSPVE